MATKAETILKEMPSVVHGHVALPSDTTNEIWIDVDTKLGAKEAWHIVGFEWKIAINTDVGAPPLAVNAGHLMQLLRTNVAEEPVDWDHSDLIVEEEWIPETATEEVFPRKIAVEAVTLSNTLRAIWRTTADETNWSASNYELWVAIYYHLITAPDDGRTKIGIPLDEI